MRLTNKRNLRAEALESRQLLHGGGMAGGGEAPTSEERATEIVSRFDANEDLELSENEVSDRLWTRLSQADGDDENSTVSVEELSAHLDELSAERAENEDGGRDRRRGSRRDRGRGGPGERVRLTVEERVDNFFTANDTNTDGVITDADEVSEDLLARIAEADVDGNGVSADELLAFTQARKEARAQERFDARFAALDANDDGGITADEVFERLWTRISAADGEGGDGIVTADELQTYLEAQRAERQAEREADAEGSEGEQGEEGEGEAPGVEGEENQGQGQRGRGNRTGRGGGRGR